MANIEVETRPLIDVSKSKMEIVERKGIGHPDSLSDSCAALLSIVYSRYCLENFGGILHHNVDKVAMAGGASDANFGNGVINDPAQFLFVGRGINQVENKTIPISDMAKTVVEKIARRNVGPSFSFKTDSRWVKPGSLDLITNFRDEGVPKANDTSFATSWAPLSHTEKNVLEIEKFLTGKFRKDNPYVGTDVKVMGRRIKDKDMVTLAVAFVASEIASMKEYLSAKKEIVSAVAERFGLNKEFITINTADNIDKGVVYLTVSGSSAECGDDGQVGRGNRITGLIAPARPNTLEAVAGKNPNKHVGNFYNVWATMIAKRIWNELNVKNDVQIVSTLGKPITDCDLFVRTDSDGDENAIKNIVRDVVGSYAEITKNIIDGKVSMYPYDMVNELVEDSVKRFI
jgi:S-adenosylmethionine synthetase